MGATGVGELRYRPWIVCGVGVGKRGASCVSEQPFPAWIHSAWTRSPRCHDAEPRDPVSHGSWTAVVEPRSQSWDPACLNQCSYL